MYSRHLFFYGGLQRLLQNRRSCVDVQRFFSETDERGKTPLMWACLNHSVDVIKFLPSNEVDLYARDFSGQTPFLHACRGNTREVLEFLARRGARVHDIDNDGRHGVHRAARCYSREVLELLFEELQADIHIRLEKPPYFQFITLRRQAGLRTFCFYFRTIAACNDTCLE